MRSSFTTTALLAASSLAPVLAHPSPTLPQLVKPLILPQNNTISTLEEATVVLHDTTQSKTAIDPPFVTRIVIEGQIIRIRVKNREAVERMLPHIKEVLCRNEDNSQVLNLCRKDNPHTDDDKATTARDRHHDANNGPSHAAIVTPSSRGRRTTTTKMTTKIATKTTTRTSIIDTTVTITLTAENGGTTSLVEETATMHSDHPDSVPAGRPSAPTTTFSTRTASSWTYASVTSQAGGYRTDDTYPDRDRPIDDIPSVIKTLKQMEKTVLGLFMA